MKKTIPLLLLCALLCGCSLLNSVMPRISESPAPPATLPPAAATATPSPTAAPVPTPTPVPTPEPTAAPVAGTVTLKDAGSLLYARVGPSADEEAVGVLENGAVVPVLEDLGDWYRIRFGERELYVSSDYMRLDPAAAAPETNEVCYYVKPSRGYEETDDPSGAVDENGNKVKIQKEVVDNLIDVHYAVPSLDIVMIFSTPDNFTGVEYYPEPVCLLQAGTAAKLKKAQEKFQADGYCIRVYDAYRPLSVQQKLFEFVGGDRTYIASPETGSKHNRGAAVDITLLDSAGNELEMPSQMHTMDTSSARNNPNMTAKAKENMDYMTRIMESCGFSSYNGEWWHFNDDDFAEYMRTDHDLSKALLYIRKAG